MLQPNLRILFLLTAAPLALRADITLPAVLGSHMVIQRGQPVHLWGWAEPGEQVSAELKGVSRNTTADKLGKWSLYLPPQSAGGPFSIKVSGKNSVVLGDVLFGD